MWLYKFYVVPAVCKIFCGFVFVFFWWYIKFCGIYFPDFSIFHSSTLAYRGGEFNPPPVAYA